MNEPLFAESFLRQLDRLAMLSRQIRRGQMQGERRSPKRGQAVEFADYRDYVPGDDLRAVDWNVYARLERLFVKLFVEEEDTRVHLLLDASQSMDYGEPGKWPLALRLAGALGYVALAGMDRLSAVALGGGTDGAGQAPPLLRMPPLRGKRQAVAWFEWLAARRTAGVASLGPALRYYAGVVRPPGIALLVSDLLDPSWEEGIAALASARFEVTVLHVLSPQELDPDLEGDLQLVDSETGGTVEITADYDLLRRYRSGLATWQEQVRQACVRRGVHYVPVSSAQDVAILLLTYLRQQAVLS